MDMQKETFSLSSRNHEELRAPVRGERFEIIMSTLWCKMLLCQQNCSSGTQHPELFVVSAIRI